MKCDEKGCFNFLYKIPQTCKLYIWIFNWSFMNELAILGKGSYHNSKFGKSWETIPTSPDPPPRLGIFQKVEIFLLFLKVQPPLYDSLF